MEFAAAIAHQRAARRTYEWFTKRIDAVLQGHAQPVTYEPKSAEGNAVKILSREETSLWCSQHEIALSDRGLPERADASGKFRIPEDAGKRVCLVSHRMQAFSGEPTFLVWFHDWDVWPSGQRMHIFDRFRMSYGEHRRLFQSPGHIFEDGEIDDAISFVTLAVLFLWDCYVVTPKRSKFLFFSHDEYGLKNGIDEVLQPH